MIENSTMRNKNGRLHVFNISDVPPPSKTLRIHRNGFLWTSYPCNPKTSFPRSVAVESDAHSCTSERYEASKVDSLNPAN